MFSNVLRSFLVVDKIRNTKLDEFRDLYIAFCWHSERPYIKQKALCCSAMEWKTCYANTLSEKNPQQLFPWCVIKLSFKSNLDTLLNCESVFPVKKVLIYGVQFKHTTLTIITTPQVGLFQIKNKKKRDTFQRFLGKFQWYLHLHCLLIIIKHQQLSHLI